MHLKNIKLIVLGVLAVCIYASSVFAKTPSMSEYFSYEKADNYSGQTNKDIFVLDTVSVVGLPTKNKELKFSEFNNNSRSVHRKDLEPRKKYFRDIEIRIVTEIEPEDFLSTLNFAGPAEFVQKLQNTTKIGGMNIYIKSGLAWKVNKDLSIIAPYARGRLVGVAINYKSPTTPSN